MTGSEVWGAAEIAECGFITMECSLTLQYEALWDFTGMVYLIYQFLRGDFPTMSAPTNLNSFYLQVRVLLDDRRHLEKFEL